MSPAFANLLNYLVIAIYTLVVIGIGIYFSREKKNSETYLLGGRSMPHWAIGLACMMSLFSSISIVMVPGEIFNNGLTLYIVSGFLAPFLVVPSYLLFTRFYFQLGSFTPYEYLEFRYDSTVRGIVAFSSFYSRVIYIGLVLYSSAKIFEAGYGWAPWFSILLVAAVGIACCFLGGSKAVVWTDVFQALITFGGLLAVALMLCWKIDGGLVEAIGRAFREGHGVPQFTQRDFYTLSPYVRVLFWLLLWNSCTSMIVNAASDQVTVQRILSTKNWKEGLKSQIVSTLTGLCFMCFLYFIGLALYTYYQQNPNPELVPGKGDAAFFRFVAEFMPAPFSGLFMAAMLAAIMSTVSGVVNSMSAVWLKEFHQKFINRQMNEHDEYRVLRISTLVLGGFGILLALALELSGRWLQQSVAEVGTLFGLLGAAILPAFLFAVLSKRANSKLIWAYTCWAFGEGIAMNVWYAMSRASLQNYERDHTCGFGWAGHFSYWYMVPYLVVGLILVLPYLVKSWRNRWSVKISALLGCLFLGAAEALAMWSFYSQNFITDVPQARSFAFYLPISFIGAFIILWFCPEQPRDKYQGLTLATLGQPIAGLQKDSKKA